MNVSMVDALVGNEYSSILCTHLDKIGINVDLIVTKDRTGSQTVKINLQRYTEKPLLSRYQIRPEDNIFLPVRSDPFFDFSSLGDWVTVLGAITSVIVIREMLRDDEQRSVF